MQMTRSTGIRTVSRANDMSILNCPRTTDDALALARETESLGDEKRTLRTSAFGAETEAAAASTAAAIDNADMASTSV